MTVALQSVLFWFAFGLAQTSVLALLPKSLRRRNSKLCKPAKPNKFAQAEAYATWACATSQRD
jgi:hypothetical protein